MSRMPKTGNSAEDIEDIIGATLGYGLEYNDPDGIITMTREGPNPYDKAQTFAESDLTVSLVSNTQVTNQSVELGTTQGTGSGWGVDTGNQTDRSARQGMRFNPNKDLAGIHASLSGSTEADTVYIYDRDASEYVVNGMSVTQGGEFDIYADLTAGTSYNLLADAGGATYNDVVGDGGVFPRSTTDIDLDGYGGADYAINFDSLNAITYDMAGQVNLEWPYPTDVYEWDVATFTTSPDGESVDVYIAYSTDGGSSWNRTNSGNPVIRNYSLANDPNISAGDDVRMEVELSRADKANNPTLDSAYRSWRL
ncbi:glycoside hydrolase family 32 protein [Halobellus captivus]|uniref:glycoside hydrolase family 32 protein n=1 Tax=Halobellus captivus TaxID=2592614 RepID=UPI0011A373D3|nr:glycoside hydrolase family 32 protein [Halobellus captivus]